ncbi:protein-disulfide reductase DsbD family protein [Acidiphilium sp. PA]|uniref:protein-disulfide reductase DsbD family protein n=1 Tax=Acidiphilium sp. PA TaxID=2871705 RepID=UPI002243A202|nr:protein-disulfide reductase DsbD domain-containing protein [Acidiphilium sp. PA]MCW8309075.1 protein-disulfide reductase DsbD family protein [Acidiphilium sp. PA]
MSAFAASTPWVGNKHAAARLITATEATGNASQVDAGLQIRLERGWHAYWRNPGAAGIPPSIDWTGSTNVKSAHMYWPAPHRYMLYGLVTQGYEHGVVLPLSIVPKHPGTPMVLRALVHYSACKTICIPYTAKLVLTLPAGLASPGPQAPLIARAWAHVPSTLAQAGLILSQVVISKSSEQKNTAILSLVVDARGARLSRPDLFIQNHFSTATPGAPKVWLDTGHRRGVLSVTLKGERAAAIAERKLRFTLENGSTAAVFSATPIVGPIPPHGAGASLALILAIALLGGLILNVMPCTLPVLSLKLMSFAGASGGEKRGLRITLLATALGIVVSYLVLAGVVIALKAIGATFGWGIQFQQPWFLGAMAAITTLFAASLWEWLPIPLPGLASSTATLGNEGNAGTAGFLTGVFATLLATSCSAPFIGVAVGFALAGDPLVILGIFAALGIGMALPYLLVAAFPGLVRWMPKPGRWMIALRVILGFAMLGTAIWLVWIIAFVVSPIASLFAGATLATMLALLFWRHRLRDHHDNWRHIGAIAVIAAVVGTVIEPSVIPASQAPARQRADNAVWQPFDQARIVKLVAGNTIVFVDVTAAWCLICKVNALTVLDRNPVARQLRSPGVVALRADWTRPSPPITAYLRSFGRYGVPLDVVYGPGARSGVLLPSLLTSGAVMQAFRRAAGSPRGMEAAR